LKPAVGFVPFLHHFAICGFPSHLTTTTTANFSPPKNEKKNYLHSSSLTNSIFFGQPKRSFAALSILWAAFRAQFVILMISMESSHIIEPESSSANFCFWESWTTVLLFTRGNI